MGQSKSKENRRLSKNTHFSTKEIKDLRHHVETTANSNQPDITEQVFRDTVMKSVPTVSTADDLFLKRLYAAFGGQDDKSLDFSEFVNGLSVFMKGTAKEKMELSFKLYDMDHDGYLSKEELEKVLLQLEQMTSNDDNADGIQHMIDSMFDDFDVDGDGKLSFDEYKLSAMREPLITDFLEHFLEEHHLTEKKPAPASRRNSVSSKRSSKSQTKASFRLSQAELLDYSNQQMTNITDISPSLSKRSSDDDTRLPYPLIHRLSTSTSTNVV